MTDSLNSINANNISLINTNATNISNLQSQQTTDKNNISSLLNLSVKVYGYWKSSTNSILLGSQFVNSAAYNVNSPGGNPSLSIALKNASTMGIIGILIAMPGSGANNGGGYTVSGFYDSSTYIVYISCQNGGSSPGFINGDFYYILI